MADLTGSDLKAVDKHTWELVLALKKQYEKRLKALKK